jgi:hypothetical protein
MIQLAWRFLMLQKDSALTQWYRTQTADARAGTRKTMIVGLARKLLIALWRLVTRGEIPTGVTLRCMSDYAKTQGTNKELRRHGSRRLPTRIRGGGDP